MKNIINLIVKDEENRQRVDQFISNKEKDLSRTRIKNLILGKKLLINTKTITDPSKKVFTDDRIYLTIPKPKLDPLNFKDKKKYSDRIKDAQSKTKLDDALLVSFGLIDKTPVILACFDFSFMAGSMGRYVGDGLILASEEAIKRKCSLIVVPSSGGARMQEGIFSLMQMPRSTIAINKIKKAKLPYIVLHANPTTGGVTASFAMLGDVHIAEPGAIIGFAGRRVIEETVKEKLPEDFQTAEYLKSHGMIDIVAPRSEQKTKISKLLESLTFYLN